MIFKRKQTLATLGINHKTYGSWANQGFFPSITTQHDSPCRYLTIMQVREIWLFKTLAQDLGIHREVASNLLSKVTYVDYRAIVKTDQGHVIVIDMTPFHQKLKLCKEAA